MSMNITSRWLAGSALVAMFVVLGCGQRNGQQPPDNGNGNGNSNDNESPPPESALSVFGRVIDASNDEPLAGATITAAGISSDTQTNSDGRFMLTVPQAGRYALTASLPDYTYAQRWADVPANGMTAVADMYLTPVDPAVIHIGPEGGSGANSDGSIELQVPAGALSSPADLRATRYHRGRDLPLDLPELSHFTYACDLTPDGQTFSSPVVVRMRNERGFAPGTPIPVGVYDSSTLTWEHESMGMVSADGQWVEFPVGHFSPRDCNLGRTSPTGSGEPGDAEDTTSERRAERNNQSCGSVPSGSRIDVGDGHLIVDHLAPACTTLGVRRTVALQYNSPVPSGGVALELSYDISQTRTLLPARMRLIAEIGGNRVERTYEPVDGPMTFTYRWDGRDPLGNTLPAGLYDYRLTLVNEYQVNFATASEFGGPAVTDTGVAADEYDGMGSTFTGSTMLSQDTDTGSSPYGRGWGIVGLHHLTVSEGTVSIAGGDGSRFSYIEDGTGHYAPGRGDSATLIRNGDGTYTWSHLDGMTVTFNSGGEQTRLADRNGNATVFTSSDGRLTLITDPLGGATALTFDADGYLNAVTDPAGRQTQFTIDGNGDLIGIVNPDGTERRFTYDGQHRMVAQTDAGGQTTAYSYDTAGAVTRVDRPDGTYSQHAAATGGQASYTDPAGHQYLFAVNSFGTRTAITDPLGRTTLMQRNKDDQIAALVSPSGKRSDYTYDSKGNLVGVTGFGRATSWPDTLTITYDQNLNLPLAVVDSMAGTWSAAYDSRGNVTDADLPGGRHYTCTYNDRGQRTAISLGAESMSFTYGTDGNLETITDGAGGVWRYSYDTYGNTSGVLDPDGRSWTMQYNVMNLLEQVTNAAGETIRFSYTPALGSLDIDLAGTVAVTRAITDGRGNSTSFAYDAMYRPTAITDALGNITRFTYDAAGRLSTRTEPTGAVVSFEYNAAGQLTGRSLSTGDSASYTYDPVTGLCTGMATATCQLAYEYNWFDLVSAATTTFPSSGLTASISYEYRTSNYGETLITLAVGENASDFGYGWSATGGWWPESWYGGGYFWLYPEYDSAGRPAGWYESYSGTEATYGYDGAGRLTSTTLTGSAEESILWEYSPAGYCTRMDDLDGTHTYTYDATGRLTRAIHPTGDNPTEEYSYDSAGNRRVAGRESDFTYDVANRLIRDSMYDYTYDASGNRTTRTDRTSGEVTRYTYDAESRLVGVALPDGSNVSFAYDALGRRCEKRAGAAVTHYVYDRDEVRAEFDGSGHLLRQYVLGPGTDLLEGFKDGGFESYDNYLYIRGLLGTAIGLTDMYAEPQATYRYQAFGEPVNTSGTRGDWRMFAGREYDAETGLYYLRRRYYDPSSGRFLQRDPLPVAGAVFPYVYAGNNPITARDPYGLDPVGEAGALGSLTNQYVVQPGINNLTATGLAQVGGALEGAAFPYSAAAGVFTVAGTVWSEYYGTNGHPSWADVIAVYGSSNPAEAGINWYGSQQWNPARYYLDDFLTMGGLLPRREARIGPICGLREGLRSFFGY